MNSKKGFTLIELLAVIVILAILATAAFTLIIPRVTKAGKDTFINEVHEVEKASQSYILDHPDAKIIKIKTLINEDYLTMLSNSDLYDGYISVDETNTYIFMTNGKYMTKRLLKISEVNERTIISADQDDFEAALAAADMQIVTDEIVSYAKKNGTPYTYTGNDPALALIKEKTGIEVTKIDMVNEGIVGNTESWYVYIKLSNGYTTCKPSNNAYCCVYYKNVGKKQYAKINPYRADYNCHRTSNTGVEMYNWFAKYAKIYS